MKIRELLNRALFYLSVPKCVYCKERLDYGDRGLCKDCFKKHIEHKKRNCSICSRVLSECSCSTYYLEAHYVKRMTKLFRYIKREEAMASNHLIYSLKRDHRRDVIDLLGEELSEAIRKTVELDKGTYFITNVPRRRRIVLKYGFDQSELLARNIADRLGIEYHQFLRARAKHAQKGMSHNERYTNAKFDYKPFIKADIKGQKAIIVDDVATTGASIAACAALLHRLGARKISGAVLGIAYKDSYTPPITFDLPF